MYVGITDYEWFKTLQQASCDEVNFWRPSGQVFKALDEGDLFLFKLHSPRNYIVGGGIFLRFIRLPSSLAWEAFEIANGAKSYYELVERVYKYRKTDRYLDSDPQIGCIILSMPFYFEEKDWIPVPDDWKKAIQTGKTYDTSEYNGMLLYSKLQEKLYYSIYSDSLKEDVAQSRYGKEQVIKPRLGQGSFRVFITEAYHRRCAITGEKTLPALEAAHIKPFALNGTHELDNGLLLRRDFHRLLDRGYITIDKNFNIEVSRRIKDDFGNGQEYYSHHGRRLIILPDKKEQQPNLQYLEWHNDNIYLG